MAYSFQDRLSEWTTVIGGLVAVSAAAIPIIAPVGPWIEAWQAAQLFLSAVLIFVPQNAGTTAVENDGLQLLKALADHVPPQYASALTPFMTVLSAAVMKPKPVIMAPVAPPAPTPAPIAPVVMPSILTPAPAAPLAAATPSNPVVVEQLPIPGAPVVAVDPAVLAQVQASQNLHA